jgi:hypothetical protein
MPKPLAGLVAAAEVGSVFEADVAIGALADAGVQAVSSYDPALNSVAGYLASDRTVDVLVHVVDLERARAVLDARSTHLPDAFSDETIGDWPRTNRLRAVAKFAIMVSLIALLLTMAVGAVAAVLH